jgi:NAD-dependent deacetylase
MNNDIKQAAQLIKLAKHCVVFTGAGISVESGIPPFRGDGGLWGKYDPMILDINYYKRNTQDSWAVIKQIFYDYFGKAKPNDAHLRLAEWERDGLVSTVITQNIDNLHSKAGSKNVLEFHGTSGAFVCMNCGKRFLVDDISLENEAPRCSECKGLLKPDFIFFGEAIPEPAGSLSFQEAKSADVFLIIGTSGGVVPASYIPSEAKTNGAKIIEINLDPTNFTTEITDIYLSGKAGDVMNKLNDEIINMR